jgi:hypothetical protein
MSQSPVTHPCIVGHRLLYNLQSIGNVPPHKNQQEMHGRWGSTGRRGAHQSSVAFVMVSGDLATFKSEERTQERSVGV